MVFELESCRFCSYATLYPALSVRPSVRPSVGRLVGPHFTFFMFLRSLASLLLAKCFSNSNTVPAHPHVTEVAVNPVLFLNFRYQRQRICIIVCLLKKEHHCKYGNVNQYCCCSTVPFLDFFRDYMHSKKCLKLFSLMNRFTFAPKKAIVHPNGLSRMLNAH